MRWLRARLTRADRALGRMGGRRRVIVDARTPMNLAILAPVAERLQRDPRVDVYFTASHADAAADGPPARVRTRAAMKWRRIDLALSADPWDPIVLRRCSARLNFFHGVAGKYDLDSPGHLPIDFGQYDRVGFVNADRMRRYLDAGIVSRAAAVLIGYPKVDALVNGRYDPAAVHARLQLEMHRRTAIYAPTWSPASSLHIAGEAIVEQLVESGFNVIVKLHDRSLDRSEPKYSGGVDWRARFARLHRPGRVAFVEAADASPLLAASDVMVTDHSSIGFEFCLLDRPLIVFDAPDLPRVARINPEKIVQLRTAARVVGSAVEVGRAALGELAHPERAATARRRIVSELFHEPGTATLRALQVVYELLELPMRAHAGTEVPDDLHARFRPHHGLSS